MTTTTIGYLSLLEYSRYCVGSSLPADTRAIVCLFSMLMNLGRLEAIDCVVKRPLAGGPWLGFDRRMSISRYLGDMLIRLWSLRARERESPIDKRHFNCRRVSSSNCSNENHHCRCRRRRRHCHVR